MDTTEPTTELVHVQAAGPSEMYRQATDVAGLCGEIVKRTAKKIQGRSYVGVEGWQAIATTHGCMLGIESVTEDEQGNISAIASLRRICDGVLLSKAEGFVGTDEPTWQKRPHYARRAMAQTRAMSRVARSAFAHVVVMIGSGLSTTPAEEMGAQDSLAEAPAPQTSDDRRHRDVQRPEQQVERLADGTVVDRETGEQIEAPRATGRQVQDLRDLLERAKAAGLASGATAEKWHQKYRVTSFEELSSTDCMRLIQTLRGKLDAAPRNGNGVPVGMPATAGAA